MFLLLGACASSTYVGPQDRVEQACTDYYNALDLLTVFMEAELVDYSTAVDVVAGMRFSDSVCQVPFTDDLILKIPALVAETSKINAITTVAGARF
jgi:hypothetical protein